MNKIRVVLVEDHNLSRVGLCAALGQFSTIEVVGDAADGHQGLQIIARAQPDVAIIDIGLPDIDGIELTQKIKQAAESEGYRPRILILTMHKNKESVLAAFAAGADSYSLKDVSLDNLVQAIQVTSEGNSWIDPAIARLVLQQTQQSESTQELVSQPVAIGESAEAESHSVPDYALTDRELEVLELIVAGCSNAQIAEKLYITVGTVKTHVRNILSKLCADDRTQAAVRALRSGLVG